MCDSVSLVLACCSAILLRNFSRAFWFLAYDPKPHVVLGFFSVTFLTLPANELIHNIAQRIGKKLMKNVKASNFSHSSLQLSVVFRLPIKKHK